MFNILKEFANNNLHPDSCYFIHNSEYGRATKRLADTESVLIDTLNEPQRKLLNAYTKAQDEIHSLSNTDKFIYGYRLGVLMTMEVFRMSDDIVFGEEVE